MIFEVVVVVWRGGPMTEVGPRASKAESRRRFLSSPTTMGDGNKHSDQ